MKPNDIVMIYEDPITQLKPEGIATLQRLIDTDPDTGLSRWKVKFAEDPFLTYTRSVFAGAGDRIGEHEITIRQDALVLARLLVQREAWMEDADFNIKLTETAVEWASRSGRVYDDLEWEWL